MKKINLYSLIKAIVFGLFGIAIFHIGTSGNLALILHPKMFKFTYFAGGIFLIAALYSLRGIFLISNRKVDYRIFVFLLPILLMFGKIEPLKGDALKNMSYDVLNHSNIVNRALQSKQKNIEEKNSEISQVKEEKEIEPKQDKEDSGVSADARLSDKERSSGASLDEIAIPKQHEGSMASANISAQDDVQYLPSVEETKGKNYDIAKFLDDMLEAYAMNGDGSSKFEHQEFEIVGFVYRDDFFEKNQFMVGRMLLTCCISDAQQIGVLVQGLDSDDYREHYSDDSWVSVRGKLYWQELYNPNTKENNRVLTLKPTVIEQIEDIEYPYVYFE